MLNFAFFSFVLIRKFFGIHCFLEINEKPKKGIFFGPLPPPPNKLIFTQKLSQTLLTLIWDAQSGNIFWEAQVLPGIT